MSVCLSSTVHSWLTPHTACCFHFLSHYLFSLPPLPQLSEPPSAFFLVHGLSAWIHILVFFAFSFAPLTALIISAFESSVVWGLLTFRTVNIWTGPTLVSFCVAFGAISRSPKCPKTAEEGSTNKNMLVKEWDGWDNCRLNGFIK